MTPTNTVDVDQAEADRAELLWARRRRGRRFRRATGALLVLLVLYLAFTAAQVWAADSWDHTRPSDAAIVLGAAQYNGRPSAAFRGRLDKARELYEAGTVPLIVVTGGRAEGDRYTEAYSGLTYLRRAGVPERAVVVVDDGSSTWESMAASVRVLRRRGVRRVLLVSDPYHSFRLEAIASEVGFDGKVSPTSASSTNGELFRESMLVAAGRIIGYRRLVNLVE
ncbi:MAG: YdcF family protein [Acidimicrobiales bacterium]